MLNYGFTVADTDKVVEALEARLPIDHVNVFVAGA